MPNLQFRRKHYHSSPKAGVIYCDSSYELRAVLLLDADANVLTYETQIPFIVEERNRRIDFLVTMVGGKKKIVEVKPRRRVDEFRQQIEDNRVYAGQNGWDFEVWSEPELGFATPHEATKWYDEHHSEISGLDFVQARKERGVARAKKHYYKHVATNKVTVQCEFCDCAHDVLEVNYLKNMERNGRYICEREGGFIAGSKPKKKKVNPYAAEDKKECVRCHSIKLFEEFGEDKSRADGYASRCKICRAEVAKQKYSKRLLS